MVPFRSVPVQSLLQSALCSTPAGPYLGRGGFPGRYAGWLLGLGHGRPVGLGLEILVCTDAGIQQLVLDWV